MRSPRPGERRRHLEHFSFAFGDKDAVVIVDVPDNEAAAAVALTVNSAGGATTKMTPLISPRRSTQRPSVRSSTAHPEASRRPQSLTPTTKSLTMSGMPSPRREDRIAAVRAFNRFYTARIGVLRDGLLRTPHSLTEARVLYELGQREVTEVADLRRELDIDAGLPQPPARPAAARRPRRPRALRPTTPAASASASPRTAPPPSPSSTADPPTRSAPSSMRCPRTTSSASSPRWTPSTTCSRRPRRAAGFVLREPRPRRPRLDRPAPRRALRRSSTAGTRASRRSSRASSPTTPATTTRAARPRGSPRSTASPPAACCACAATTTSPSCACCSSTRGRAGAASARG